MIRAIVSAILIVAAVSAYPRFGGRIVNGSDADIADYPYQVSIRVDDEHTCGGSIIAERFILTAAHCTEEFDVADMTVRTGSSFHARGGQLIKAKRYVMHENYDNVTMESDIAIIELAEDIVFGPESQAIELWDENNAAGDVAYISGWGVLEDDGETPDKLRYLPVPVMTREECIKYYLKDLISENMICAGYVKGEGDSCQGDSGGPLRYQRKLLGVISWGYGCAAIGYPGVYASVPKFRDFIKSVANV